MPSSVSENRVLRPRRRIDTTIGQNIYHCLNHPIQWIKITGIIVAVDEFYNRICYTVDDSSGSTIECVCLSPPKSDALPKDSTNSYSGGKFWNDTRAKRDIKKNTETPIDQRAIDDMISPDGPKLRGIDVGSVVKIKGIISVFRDVRQIAMKIIHTIPDTAAEVVEWQARNAFYKDVLGKPWLVSEEQEKKCLKDAEREKWREEEKRKRRIRKDETEEERKVRKKRERREKREQEAKQAKELEEEKKKDERRRREQWERDERAKRDRKRAEVSRKVREQEFRDRVGKVDL